MQVYVVEFGMMYSQSDHISNNDYVIITKYGNESLPIVGDNKYRYISFYYFTFILIVTSNEKS